ncbi:hypothetical protein SAMN05421504_106289 [Amycolatopsis xylanica]|uniref:Tetratricopeptide repeat-containing protein n=1 Tax=Amycolatopsis xylanica TaxID=589385 RepID=A0A1H3LPP2_9PSEU|nr:hypothetical protein [Amycolatopsis xylanica]SDY65964.1 hypothetical protein SAMN05421504_106289 [Amycolatopsis xylanica]
MPDLRAAAFGDAPVFDLPPPETPLDRLLTAIVLGARGRYAAAATLLDGLRRAEDPVIASLALSTLASHRRQLGGHDAARGLDGAAFALAMRATEGSEDPDGLDAAGARVDALLGLAADNLGAGRLTAARRSLDRALKVPTGWRGRLRAEWVTAELALASGRPDDAIEPAERANALSAEQRSRRHFVKSRLVLAATLSAGDSTGRERANELVTAALSDAEECELHSLIWPACLIAAGIEGQLREKYRFRSEQVLHAVLLRADPVGRRIARQSPWVPV